jgi:hypothetical protein
VRARRAFVCLPILSLSSRRGPLPCARAARFGAQPSPGFPIVARALVGDREKAASTSKAPTMSPSY